jgi:DNA-binding MarR family transcriptional regulator
LPRANGSPASSVTPAPEAGYAKRESIGGVVNYSVNLHTGIEETGLGLSDLGVLEALLHKGPLPVNTIGPIVDLTPGSISIAVDRLVEKGLVSRVESAEDRRVRIVALTP